MNIPFHEKLTFKQMNFVINSLNKLVNNFNMNISEQFIKDLIDQGVDTFFGVQGGACARLVDNVVKYKENLSPF